MLEREKLGEELKKALSNEEQQDLQANETLQNAIFSFPNKQYICDILQCQELQGASSCLDVIKLLVYTDEPNQTYFMQAIHNPGFLKSPAYFWSLQQIMQASVEDVKNIFSIVMDQKLWKLDVEFTKIKDLLAGTVSSIVLAQTEANKEWIANNPHFSISSQTLAEYVNEHFHESDIEDQIYNLMGQIDRIAPDTILYTYQQKRTQSDHKTISK